MKAALASRLAILASIACLSLASPSSPRRPLQRQDTTPTVDLGYELHTGSVNVSKPSSVCAALIGQNKAILTLPCLR